MDRNKLIFIRNRIEKAPENIQKKALKIIQHEHPDKMFKFNSDKVMMIFSNLSHKCHLRLFKLTRNLKFNDNDEIEFNENIDYGGSSHVYWEFEKKQGKEYLSSLTVKERLMIFEKYKEGLLTSLGESEEDDTITP